MAILGSGVTVSLLCDGMVKFMFCIQDRVAEFSVNVLLKILNVVDSVLESI